MSQQIHNKTGHQLHHQKFGKIIVHSINTYSTLHNSTVFLLHFATDFTDITVTWVICQHGHHKHQGNHRHLDIIYPNGYIFHEDTMDVTNITLPSQEKWKKYLYSYIVEDRRQNLLLQPRISCTKKRNSIFYLTRSLFNVHGEVCTI
jgi:hypothetical protein